MNWFLLGLPAIGFLLARTIDHQWINDRWAIRILIGSLLLFVFYLITDISFSFDLLDWAALGAGLFALGYGSGSRSAEDTSEEKIGIPEILKWITIVFYCLLPVGFVADVISAYVGDKLGEVVHEEKSNGYTIKHTCVNSNFMYSGDHIVNVYKSFFMVEYPVDHFRLGKYGRYGFNIFDVQPSGDMIPSNKFEYDGNKKSFKRLALVGRGICTRHNVPSRSHQE